MSVPRKRKRVSPTAVLQEKLAAAEAEIADLRRRLAELPHSQPQAAEMPDAAGRMLAVEALRESEEHFRAVLEDSLDAAYRRNLQTDRYDYMSPVFEKITGWSVQEMGSFDIGTVLGLIHPDDLSKVEQEIERTLAGCQSTGRASSTLEYRFRGKDGAYRWIEDYLVVLPDGDGRPLYRLGNIHDISARKQAEEQVTVLSRFPHENPNPVLRIDRSGKLLYANPASQLLLAEWGSATGHLIPPTWRGLVAEALTNHQTRLINTRYGETVYELLFVPVCEASYVNLYGRDVTEQAEAVEALQKIRNELELRVQERTQELLNVNEEYLMINEELRVAVEKSERIEKSLRLANTYNRSLIEASLDPLMTITSDGKISDVNSATEQVTGYTRQELIGTDFHRYFTNPTKAEAGYRQAFEAGSVRDYELEICHKDGAITPVLYNAAVYYDEAGRVTGVFAAARDITLRKQAEELLRLQTTALDSAASGIVITDRAGSIQWSNPAFSQMSGYSTQEVLGQNFRLLKSGKHDPAFYKQLWDSVLAGQVWRGDIINRRKDGNFYNEEQTIAPVLDQNGQITHFVAIKQDVTARKNAEAQVVEDAARSNSIAKVSQALNEAGPDQSLVIRTFTRLMADLLGDVCIIHLLTDDGQFLNPAAVYSASSTLPQKFLEQITAAPLRVGEGVVGQVFQTGQPVLLPEIQLEHARTLVNQAITQPLKRINLYSLLVVPLRTQGRQFGTVGMSRTHPSRSYSAADQVMVQDLADLAAMAIANARLYSTLQMSLEKEQAMRTQLVQAEKLAATGRRLASVAHELSNPLQTIKNCLFLTRQDTPPDSPVQEYLDMASSEAGRLANLVAQLRELYRPRDAGVVRAYPLSKILNDVHSLLAPHLAEHGVVWQQSPGQQDLVVNCVVDHVKQVFINISMNAIEAMQPDGGTLSINLVQSEDGDQAGAAFQDTGPGISPGILPNLYEPFVTTKTSGLGL
jgi:PAS domain S-box-containing protein